MAKDSIFAFLNSYSHFENIYEECMDMEIELKHECYKGVMRSARTISELLIKKIATTHVNYENLFFEDNGYGIYLKSLYNLIEICHDENLIDDHIYDNYDKIRKWGNNWVHGNNYSRFNAQSDSFKIHEKLFEIARDCYKKFDVENLQNYETKYEFNIDYLDENDKFTHERLLKHIHNINENEFYIDELIDYMDNQGIFLHINSFNELVKEYISYIKNLDIFDSDFKSKKIITDNDKQLILDNFEKDVSYEILDKLKDLTQIQFKEIKTILNNLNEHMISIDELNFKISADDENKLIYSRIKRLTISLSKERLNDIRNELTNIPMSSIDKNNRHVIEFPDLYIDETEDGVHLRENNNKIRLDEDQISAVKYGGKHLVINAGPGSGKTRVIIERVVDLIEEKKVDPSSILVITFTIKATEELRERLKNDTNLSINQVNQMRISTIHSFCRYLIFKFENVPYNFLMRNGEKGLFISKNKRQLGFIRECFIYPNYVKHINDAYNKYFNFILDKEKLLDYIQKEYESGVIHEDYPEFINEYYKTHNEMVPVKYNYLKSEKYARDWRFTLYKRIAESYDDFKDVMEIKKVCDNNHLLEKANDLLDDENNLKKLQYTNILIDEFQDTDFHQKELFDKLLTKSSTFTIVGDADQSIYEWRGASQDYFNEYADRDDFEVITLHKNYRSTRDIVEFNEELIKNYRHLEKDIKSKDNNYKIPVYHLSNSNDEEEITNLISIIKTLKNDGKIKYYSDIALLFRTNYRVENVISAFEDAGIPYYLKDKKDLSDQDEVKAILTLFWYLLPYRKYNYVPGNEDYLNLYGFTDEKYNASKIFKLSKETMDILSSYQKEYDEKLLFYAKINIGYSYKLDRDDLYREFFRALSDEKLDEIFENIDTCSLAELNKSQLKDLGITNAHDLNFFLKLNELYSRINDESLKNYDKPTTLNVFYKLLNILEYYDEINIQRNKVSKKIKSNLALLSEIIYDYENIVGKHYYKGLFEYLNNILQAYSCPIHDLEDNINKVHIMTIHKSKGLEYPVVILCSLKEGIQNNKKDRDKFETPIHCLKNKPNSKRIEDQNRYNEEMRIIYVATTRAKELLILSSVENNRTPIFLREISGNFKRLRSLDPYNLKEIPQLSSSGKNKEITKFPELNFEDIMRYYLFCPVCYDIFYNFKFRNKNDDSFSEDRLHTILNKLFSTNNVTEEYIDNLIEKTKESYAIPINSQTAQILNNIPNFWEDYGKDYKVFKDMVDYKVSTIMDYCDLNGTIDLIVENDDKTVSIIQIIGTNWKIERNFAGYRKLLRFYGIVLKELDNEFGILNGYTIKDIILHSIKENKRYDPIPIDVKHEKSTLKRLNKITKKIIHEDYIKSHKNCYVCDYKDGICKGH